MPNLGEATRLYQAALEAQRATAERFEGILSAADELDEAAAEVARAEADMIAAWLERIAAMAPYDTQHFDVESDVPVDTPLREWYDSHHDKPPRRRNPVRALLNLITTNKLGG